MSNGSLRRLWSATAWVLGLGAVAWRSAQQLSDTDTGFHLALGRLVDRGQFPRTNALAWTAPDHPWYPTAWLYDWALFRAVKAWDALGAQLLMFAIIVAAAVGVWWALREAIAGEPSGDDGVISPGVFLATLVLLAPRIASRSYLVAWVSLAGTLAFALAARRRGWRWRLGALPILALASNGHAGAAFGVGVLGLECVEAAWRERAWRREALVALAGIGAVMLNPGGPANLLDMFAHLRVEELVMIGEYRPPEWPAEQAFFLLLLPTVAACWLVRDRWALVASVVLFGLMGLRTVRFCYEFFIVAAPLWAIALQRLRARRPLWAPLGIAFGLSAAVAQAVPNYVDLPVGARWNPDGLPVRAARFISREGLAGRFYNAYHDGGYLAFALDQPIFQDGRPRAWPPEFWSDMYAADESPARFEAWMRKLDVEWAVTARYPTPLTGAGKLSPERWALVYWDNVNEVWLRRDAPRLASLIERLEYKLFWRYGSPDQVIVGTIARASPELLARYERELDQFERDSPGDAMALTARCYLARRRGQPMPSPACARLP